MGDSVAAIQFCKVDQNKTELYYEVVGTSLKEIINRNRGSQYKPQIEEITGLGINILDSLE